MSSLHHRRSLTFRASFVALFAAGAVASGCAQGSTDLSDTDAPDSPAANAAPALRDADPAAQASSADLPGTDMADEKACPPAEVFARAFGPGARVLHVARLALPVSGALACTAKVVGEDGSGRLLTLDGEAREVSGDALMADERAAARQKYGALRPEPAPTGIRPSAARQRT
jgi:hypothetical protein